ncbi:polysaccharide deacetylase family protein [Metabacillus bambusae]|uniref:Polysaccharide deacetylase family protein n=1 Tax=Metabacillus bambusae TaxID=2795218 RepID=A0ABS3MXM0_9BACI|nr:polysaccharide deacetylase family protein [Metabacillus bambusae]MBO1510581.1 polysaccharide deacetylase family protein [Metabacillus bambusae]
MLKKRKLVTLLLPVLLLLAGCTNEKENKDSKNEIKVDNVTDKIEDEVESVDEVVVDVANPVELETLYELNDVKWTVNPLNEDTEERVVLLTIDDAPDKYSLEMAKTLKKLNVNAIFFVNGHFIQTDEKKKMLKEIYDLGFQIGNHTMTHRNLKELTEEQQYEEIMELNSQIEKIIGEKPRFFRAPFGSNTDYSKKLIANEGMLLMNWTYGYDWEKDYMKEDALVEIMVNTSLLTNGANLLMHDRAWTNAALEGIVNGLMEKGYKMVDPATIK